jgi:hypothetical protein
MKPSASRYAPRHQHGDRRRGHRVLIRRSSQVRVAVPLKSARLPTSPLDPPSVFQSLDPNCKTKTIDDKVTVGIQHMHIHFIATRSGNCVIEYRSSNEVVQHSDPNRSNYQVLHSVKLRCSANNCVNDTSQTQSFRTTSKKQRR